METPISDGANKQEDKDFSAQAETALKQSKTLKRRDTLLVQNNPLLLSEELSDEDKKSNHRPNCFITDESHPELVYSDILEHILIFV